MHFAEKKYWITNLPFTAHKCSDIKSRKSRKFKIRNFWIFPSAWINLKRQPEGGVSCAPPPWKGPQRQSANRVMHVHQRGQSIQSEDVLIVQAVYYTFKGSICVLLYVGGISENIFSLEQKLVYNEENLNGIQTFNFNLSFPFIVKRQIFKAV